MTRRAALLMELMLSLALFASAGLAILALVHQSMSTLDQTRQTRRAVDLARSTLARIEAGVDDPQSLIGPARLWDGRAEAETSATFDETDVGSDIEADVDPLWEIEIDSAPSQFAGLNQVSVRAFRRASPGSERIVASYTLTQLVRLGALEEDAAGETGELLEEAIRGAGGRP